MSKVPINRSQGRSVVVSTGGIVASEHPLASQAGAMVLAQGGHAVDAAIAANAVMGVVCPMMCGVGGDLFAIVCEHDGTLHGVNASGWAPARLTPELLESRGESGMPQSGVHSVTVPGAVAGWSLLLDRFGRVPLARLLEPAIALADERVSGGRDHERGMAQPGGVPARRSGVGEDVPARPGGRLPWALFSATSILRGRIARLRPAAARRSIAAILRAGSSTVSSGAARRWPQPICLSSARSGPIRFRRPTAAGRSSSCRRTAPGLPR